MVYNSGWNYKIWIFGAPLFPFCMKIDQSSYFYSFITNQEVGASGPFGWIFSAWTPRGSSSMRVDSASRGALPWTSAHVLSCAAFELLRWHCKHFAGFGHGARQRMKGGRSWSGTCGEARERTGTRPGGDSGKGPNLENGVERGHKAGKRIDRARLSFLNGKTSAVVVSAWFTVSMNLGLTR